MNAHPLPADLASAVGLGAEMGRRFAEFDWAAHPLGRTDDWPPEMRSAVALTLTSRFPMSMFVGAQELFHVYNDAFIPILGDKHPVALGRAGREVWWDAWESVGPMLTNVVETGASIWSEDLMLLLDSGGRPLERYFTFSYSPLIATVGDVYGILCAVTETTERVRSERRLQLLNAVGSSIIDTRTIDDAVMAAVAVCTTQAADLPFVAIYLDGGPSGTIALRGATPSILPLLPATLGQLTAWDATTRSRTQAHVVDQLATVIPDLATVFGDHCPRQALVMPLGEIPSTAALVVGTNPLLPLDSPYRDFCQLLADQLAAAFASADSYERQRQRADALAELDQAKTAFLTNVSHEFRTPLTLLLGPIDDALADAGSDTVLIDRLDTASRNAGRLLRLVDALLDFSRIEAGHADPKLVCIDVGVLTAHIASSFTELCARAGLELVLDCESSLVDVDPDMWETIVRNLLSNAVKYTLRGSISVQVCNEVCNEATSCRITVRDTGVGIAAPDLDRLFDRFFRAGNLGGRTVEGSGIGLAVVRGLVELQRGTVQIDSESDRGTTVTIRLPLSADGIPVTRPTAGLNETNQYVAQANQWLVPASAAVSPQHDQTRHLVLIVDDNADMRAHLDRVLSSRWNTVSVADGESALNATRALHPDLVVTDVMMPGQDGFEFVAAVRADPALAATPVLMLSARAGAEAVSEGFAGGADDYLPKPFRSQDLVDRVASRLAAVERERNGHRLTAGLMQLDAAVQGADSIAEILDAVLASPVGCRGAT
ncbi:MAG: hypothetical protein QOG37_493, partial [Mycobacterium sp.]|nr:hypothetical protein [Mycobacterium sp.]